jgi:hypothetical protein
MEGSMKNVIAFPRQTPTDVMPRLDEGERLFLWGFRTIARHLRCECQAGVVIRQAYEQFVVDDAVASLEMLIEAFAYTAHTAIEVHSPDCPCVSACEMSLLRAMAAAQSGDLDAARRQFEVWLPELAADWILGPARGLGTIFQDAGLTFSERKSGMQEEANGNRPMPRWPAGSQARH